VVAAAIEAPTRVDLADRATRKRAGAVAEVAAHLVADIAVAGLDAGDDAIAAPLWDALVVRPAGRLGRAGDVAAEDGVALGAADDQRQHA
jgi:hypothetical protein